MIPNTVALGRIAEFEKCMAGEPDSWRSKALLMKLTLETAVPFLIYDLEKAGGPSQNDLEFIDRFASRLASHSDVLMFREKGEWVKKELTPGRVWKGYFWGTAEMMTQLCHAVAIMAFCPGGVAFCGLHFEAKAGGSS